MPLAKGAVQGRADIGHLHAQQIGLVAVDPQGRLQALDLRIAGDVAERGIGAHASNKLFRPVIQGIGTDALQGVLVAALALASAQLQVLHGTEIHGHAGHGTRRAAQVFQHHRHFRPFAARFQHHEHAARVAATDERGHILHAGVRLEHGRHARLQVLQCRRGNILRRFRIHLDLAQVFLGEETLRNGRVQQHRQRKGTHGNKQHHVAVRQGLVEQMHIAVAQLREPRLEVAADEGLFAMRGVAVIVFARVGRQEAAGQHRHQGQRHDGRDEDGQRDDDGKLVEQQADHARHEEDGDEHGHQRDGNRNDGETHFLGAHESRLDRFLAHLDMAHDVFQHHDGIVDHQAHGQGDTQQGDIVEAVAKPVQQGQRTEQGNRHGDGGNESGGRAVQEQKDHQHHQDHRQGQGQIDVVDRFADRDGTVIDQADLNGSGQLRLETRQELAHGIDHLHRVRIRLALHQQGDRALAIETAGRLG